MSWKSAASVVLAFAVGFGLAYYRGEEKLKDAQLDAAVVRAQDGRKAYERLVEAQEALDALRAERVDVDAELERLRRAVASRAERPSASACGMERAAVARCESLLRESAELLAEGSGLLQRNSDIHDAVVRAVGQVK